MKKILLFVFMLTSLATYSQKTDLSTVNTVKPKKGHKMAFEAAYKLHIAKFHKADQKQNVYEILSGPLTGYYHLSAKGRSFADLDKVRPDANAHSLDLDRTFFPLLDETINGTYRYVDSLSIRPEVVADKYIVNVRHLHQNINMADYTREMVRSAKIYRSMKDGFMGNLSTAFSFKLWTGSDPVTITIRNLKDGFKSLEDGYYGIAVEGSPTLKSEYITAYGMEAWDARLKIIEGAVAKSEQYIMKLRKDLSSK
ncbi:MAG: hypothetical protein ABIQ56_02095 [Chitinophagaceae bacterium]